MGRQPPVVWIPPSVLSRHIVSSSDTGEAGAEPGHAPCPGPTQAGRFWGAYRAHPSPARAAPAARPRRLHLPEAPHLCRSLRWLPSGYPPHRPYQNSDTLPKQSIGQ